MKAGPLACTNVVSMPGVLATRVQKIASYPPSCTGCKELDAMKVFLIALAVLGLAFAENPEDKLDGVLDLGEHRQGRGWMTSTLRL